MQAYTLILGGTSPLGQAICRKLSQEGHHLLIHYHNNSTSAQQLKEQCSDASVLQGDFSSSEGIHTFVENVQASFCKIKHLVYIIGPYYIGSGLKTPSNVWNELYQLNTFAPLFLLQSFADQLIQAEGAVLTFGVAGIGKNRANCYNTAYLNSKESLWHAMHSIAKELAPHNVRVNMISPGHLEGSIDLEAFAHKLPNQRPVKHNSVAELAYFLLSECAKDITGQNIEVEGGAFL